MSRQCKGVQIATPKTKFGLNQPPILGDVVQHLKTTSLTIPTSATRCVITRNTSESSWSRSPVTVKSLRPAVRRSVSKSGAMGRWTCWANGHMANGPRLQSHPSGGYSSLWQSVQCFARMVCCSLVGKRRLLVHSGASYGNGKLGGSTWKVVIKAASGARAGQTLPGTESGIITSSVTYSSNVHRRIATPKTLKSCF